MRRDKKKRRERAAAKAENPGDRDSQTPPATAPNVTNEPQALEREGGGAGTGGESRAGGPKKNQVYVARWTGV